MADWTDESSEKQELLERMNLKVVQAQANKLEVERAKNGTCLWCEKKIPAPRRWCDATCRDFWQLYAPK